MPCAHPAAAVALLRQARQALDAGLTACELMAPLPLSLVHTHLPDVAKALGQDDAVVRLLLRKLARLGLMHQVVRDLFLSDVQLRQMADVLLKLSKENPQIQVTTFRDALGLGRKRCIQYLEYFDRVGLTRRLGESRQIRPDNALANACAQ